MLDSSARSDAVTRLEWVSTEARSVVRLLDAADSSGEWQGPAHDAFARKSVRTKEDWLEFIGRIAMAIEAVKSIPVFS